MQPRSCQQRRIAVLLPDLRPGGAEHMHVRMAHEWIARGASVNFVLLRRKGELLDSLPAQVRVIDLGADQFRAAIEPLREYLGHEKPSVLLAAMWPLTIVAVIAARISAGRTRVVISEHSILSESYRGWGLAHRIALRASMGIFYRLAHERIGVSQGVAADMAALSAMHPRRIRVIHNPAACSSDMQSEADVPPELASMEGALILAVGTLKPVKDYGLLIEAFSRLASDTTATLCILGEGQLRPDLERLVRDKGLEGKVLLPGFRASTAVWYRQADLFVLASRHEGFGNVIVEALSAGVPVVSTDCPSGPREILCDGRYGRLVPVNDPDALAAAMREALQAPHDRAALKARASDFAVGKIAQEYLDILLPERRAGVAS